MSILTVVASVYKPPIFILLLRMALTEAQTQGC